MLDILRNELSGDPLTRGYAGMTNEAAAVDLNTAYRTQNRTSMTGSEVLNAIVETAYNALTDAKKDRVWQVLHLGELNPFGVEADLLIDIFGAGSATILALQVARVESISRADELGLTRVREGTVGQARA